MSKLESTGTSPPDSAASAVSSFPSQPLPKDKFPSASADPDAAYQLVHDQLLPDGNSRQNLATFCQTWVEPQVHKLMDECLDKNMVDRDEYPQMAEIEARCVRTLADLNCRTRASTSLLRATAQRHLFCARLPHFACSEICIPASK